MPSRLLDKTRMLQQELSVKRSDLQSWLTKESSASAIMGFSLRAGNFGDEYDDTDNLDVIVEDCTSSNREMFFKQRSDISNVGKVDIDLFSDEFRSSNRRMIIDTVYSEGQPSNGNGNDDASRSKSHALIGKLKRLFSRKKSRKASLW